MPRDATFWKYEGTANDFVVVERDDALDDAFVRAVCDRHRGVGADGVLVVAPGRGTAVARMIVRNADGSRPEMCGNGVRCVALHLALRGLAPSATIAIDTDAGVRRCVIERDARGAGDEEAIVAVGMGSVTVGARESLRFQDRDVVFHRADAGNPHAVTFDALDDATLDALGASLQGSAQFPNGVNLERVRIVGDRHVRVDVFERGVGRTLACGTGACAVAAVVRQVLGLSRDAVIDVDLPGGTLRIAVEPSANGAGETIMRGGARRVFAGSFAASLLALDRAPLVTGAHAVSSASPFGVVPPEAKA